MKNLLIFLLLGLLGLSSLMAQETQNDSIAPMQLEEPNRFDFIIQRSLLLGSADSMAVLKNSSGSWFLGLGFKLPIAHNRLGVRVQPGINWLKFNHAQNDTSKSFPNSRNDYSVQRHRLAYVELPVGVYYNITLDEERNPKAFVEAGGFVGYGFDFVLKTKETTLRDQGVTTKTNNLPDVEPLRYGLYGRVGYRWLALHVSYRLTDVFEPFVTDIDGTVTTTPYPIFPSVQFGVTVLL